MDTVTVPLRDHCVTISEAIDTSTFIRKKFPGYFYIPIGIERRFALGLFRLRQRFTFRIHRVLHVVLHHVQVRHLRS